MKRTLLLLAALSVYPPALAADDSEWLRPEWKSCKTDSDCVQVEAGCSGCCQYSSVNRDSKAPYEAALAKQCEGYHGGVCECMPGGNPSVSCKANACTFTLCPSTANGPWFAAQVTLDTRDLPAGLRVQKTHSPAGDIDQLAAADPVYILGAPTEVQKNMRPILEGYRVGYEQRLAGGAISPETYRLDMESYHNRLRLYDLDTPWEKKYGLARRVTLAEGHAYAFSADDDRRYSDDSLWLKSIPGMNAASGKGRPEEVAVPPAAEFTVPVLWKERAYRLRGTISYRVNPQYQSCQ